MLAQQRATDSLLGAVMTRSPDIIPPGRATSRMRRGATALLAMTVFLALGPRQAWAYGDPAEGHQLATAWCSSCHQVDPQAQHLATDAVPSFQTIAAMPSTTSMSIRAFLSTTHNVMPNFRLTDPQIEDVGAYILSLRSRPPG
jgi:mono/diheme cytochrome c family protein